MNEQKQIEAMARVDGFLGVRLCAGSTTLFMGEYEETGARYWTRLPVYLTDHNAVQRVLLGFSGKELVKYNKALIRVLGLTPQDSQSKWLTTWLATCAQKVEAILKAKGEWE